MAFVDSLSPESYLIKDVNETFNEIAENFKLASFWESTGTSVLGVSTIISLIR